MRSRIAIRDHFIESFQGMYPGKKIKDITFILTHDCDCMCTYCYQHNKFACAMTPEIAKRCIDFLYEQDAANSDYINDTEAFAVILEFIGGEPFLEIDLINQIMDYFLSEAIRRKHRWAIHYMINITTNGLHWDDPKVKQFVQLYQGRLSISVTIDGDKEAHDACRIDKNGNGTYDRAIQMFRDVGNKFGSRKTKYTIAPGNIKILSKSIKHMIVNDGCNAVNCNCVYEKGWTTQHAMELYYQLKDLSDFIQKQDEDIYVTILDWEAGDHMYDSETQNWCGGDFRMMSFDTDGSILPCMRYSSVSVGGNQPAYTLGNVYDGIGHTPEEQYRLDEVTRITRQSQSDQKCLDCPINRGCGWCSGYNYEMTGSPNKRVTYICEMHQARVMAQCYHHNKLHLLHDDHAPKAMNIPRDWAINIIGEEEYEMLRQLEKEATGSNAVE